MLGRRSDQRGFFEADHNYLDHVGKETFYGFLASLRGTLFRDEEFAAFYDEKGIGRPSVPPSLLATALLLQTFERVSDAEARDRATFDVRWKVALGICIDEQPFAKSTLQLFRAQLVLHEAAAAIFRRSLELAFEKGYATRNRTLRVALDTTKILGRGAVKDTYNLLGDGIVLILRQLAKLAGIELADYATQHGFGRYVSNRSLKGESELNWDDEAERLRLLREIVADADKLLQDVGKVRATLTSDGPEDERLRRAAERLSQVLLQDIDRKPEGASLHEGVAKDRMPSMHDPEMRHGHKSEHNRFNGHKAQIGVDTETQLITGVDVVPGNAADNSGALELVQQVEINTEMKVGETIGDCAYGDGATRQQFADAERVLVAKVATTRNGDCFPKTDFVIDLTATTCLCPAGKHGLPRYSRPAGEAQERKLRGFRFSAEECAACPLRAQCVRGKGGRSIAVHPQEALLQQARAFQRSPEFRPYKRARQAVEHRIARLVQLGIRQARYFGRAKTLFQLLMAATVANLTLLVAHGQLPAPSGGPTAGQSGLFLLALIAVWGLLGPRWTHTRPHSGRRSPNRRSLSLGATAITNFRTAPEMAPSRPHF